jgi:hypothetical protein
LSNIAIIYNYHKNALYRFACSHLHPLVRKFYKIALLLFINKASSDPEFDVDSYNDEITELTKYCCKAAYLCKAAYYCKSAGPFYKQEYEKIIKLIDENKNKPDVVVDFPKLDFPELDFYDDIDLELIEKEKIDQINSLGKSIVLEETDMPTHKRSLVKIFLDIVKFIANIDDSFITRLALFSLNFNICDDKLCINVEMGEGIEMGTPLIIMQIFGLGKPPNINYEFDIKDFLCENELKLFEQIENHC